MSYPQLLANGLIISVGEARKVLGEESKYLSDEELTMLIVSLSELAHHLLKYKHFAE